MESSRDMNIVGGHGNEQKLLRNERRRLPTSLPFVFQHRVLHSMYGTAASQWTCRAPARDAGKANYYQYLS